MIENGVVIECDKSATGAIKIPKGVKSIGEYAFTGCANLTSVTIPKGVISIGYGAFSNKAWVGCDNLTYVTIPNSVTSIGGNAFFGCNELKTVKYKGTLAQWCAMDNDYSLIFNAKHIQLSDGTDLKKLTELTIPNGVTSIGNYAFACCDSLTSVTIPGSVTSIGSSVFADCSLRSVTIQEGVTSIGDWAFADCYLTSITIPNSVTSIGSSAFYECYNLKTVNYGGTKEQWGKITIDYSYSEYSDLKGKTIIGSDGTSWKCK